MEMLYEINRNVLRCLIQYRYQLESNRDKQLHPIHGVGEIT